MYKRQTLPTGKTTTIVTEASVNDMIKGAKVIVAWDYNDAGAKTAAYVYVIDTEGSAVTPTQSKYKVNSTSGYSVTVNNAILANASNYTNTATGSAADALAGAVANATELSLKTLPYATVGSANYTIAATNTTNGAIYVYHNAAAIPSTAVTAGNSGANVSWNGTLGVGYYVVIADASSANGTANYYQVYKIVE